MTSLPRVVRFGIIGAVTTGGYALLALLGKAAGIPVVAASLCAYLAMMAFSYFGHRHLTFESERPHREAASRFVALNLFGLLLSLAVPWLLCDRIGLSASVGLLTVAVLVPLSSFVGQSLFVFPDRAASAARR
jgi:putative flippase GtrA